MMLVFHGMSTLESIERCVAGVVGLALAARMAWLAHEARP